LEVPQVGIQRLHLQLPPEAAPLWHAVCAECWAHVPAERPSFELVAAAMAAAQKELAAAHRHHGADDNDDDSAPAADGGGGGAGESFLRV
jgi:hypothetical protein